MLRQIARLLITCRSGWRPRYSGAISASPDFQSFAPSGAFSEKFTLENSVAQRRLHGPTPRHSGAATALINPRAETAP